MLKTIMLRAIESGARTRREIAEALSQGKRHQLSPYEVGLLAALVAEGAVIEEARPYGTSGARVVKQYRPNAEKTEKKDG